MHMHRQMETGVKKASICIHGSPVSMQNALLGQYIQEGKDARASVCTVEVKLWFAYGKPEMQQICTCLALSKLVSSGVLDDWRRVLWH